MKKYDMVRGMIRIAVIGYGYWGPNLVRNVQAASGSVLSYICDTNPKVLPHNTHVTTRPHDVFDDPHTDAVIIATPPSTHAGLAFGALAAGKHVLVEKPMTTSTTDAKKLIASANKHKKILMVDHTFLYTPAVRMLKKIIASKSLGTIISVDSVRTNLGLFQKDSNVIADLAVHDFSIMNYIFSANPKRLTATGRIDRSLGQETVAHISAIYPDNIFFHTHVSWLSPIKIRRMIIVGTKKMLVYDDIEPSEKIKIYDKSITVSHDLRVGYRSGAVYIPSIPIKEGLTGVIQEFIRAIRTGTKPLTDAAHALDIVRIAQQATKSIRSVV